MAASKPKKSASVVSRKAEQSPACLLATSTLEEVQTAQKVLELKIKAHTVAVSAAFFGPG